MEKDVRPRPGRKLAAAKREVARKQITAFAHSETFNSLDRATKVAIFTLCPEAKKSYENTFENY